jgi:16S rRNA (cytosine1402-N4)-methyltransferase
LPVVEHGHDPVLLGPVLSFLDPPEEPLAGKVAVDCTLGRGGHAVALARRLGPAGRLIGLDVDPANLAYARERIEAAGIGCRLDLIHANFAELPGVLADLELAGVEALLADLGVSTNQLLPGGRGLSFDDAEAPLDMRLDPRLDRTAADLLARWPEKRIADTIYGLAQERFSRRIARRIVEARRERPIATTGELADLVRRCVPRRRGGPDPATRTFMALRMAVNDEVAVLERFLGALPDALTPGGRAAVISFHSGEDRPVKLAFRQALTDGRLELPVRKPMTPDADEVLANPRSRSAKLRLARRPRDPPDS